MVTVESKARALQQGLPFHFHSVLLAEAHPDCCKNPQGHPLCFMSRSIFLALFSNPCLSSFMQRPDTLLMGGIQCFQQYCRHHRCQPPMSMIDTEKAEDPIRVTYTRWRPELLLIWGSCFKFFSIYF